MRANMCSEIEKLLDNKEYDKVRLLMSKEKYPELYTLMDDISDDLASCMNKGTYKTKQTDWQYPYEAPVPFERYVPPQCDLPIAKAMYAIVGLVCVCVALSGVIIALVEIVI